MASVKLVEAALPKSTSGRKPVPADPEIVKALADSLKSNPVVDGRPRALGTPEEFSTKGRASAMGRKYADAVSEILEGVTVRVNIYSEAKDKPPFHWRIYIPLSSQESQGATEDENAVAA